MTRRSFLSTLTACLAALGLKRKAEPLGTWNVQEHPPFGIKGLVDDGTFDGTFTTPRHVVSRAEVERRYGGKP